MTRLLIVVEGQTEEAFVKDLLIPHLADHGVFAAATIVGKGLAQKRGRLGMDGSRGGGRFRHWLSDIQRLLGGDRTDKLRVTTLFDLYGLPDDFPGLAAHSLDLDTSRRCDALQRALAETIGDRRFLAYLQRHEFEALVLAALPSLRSLLDAPDDLAGIDALATLLEGTPPEDVNDGVDTAPSKRLLRHIPGYQKTLHGPLAASGAGLAALRNACPRFNGWVHQLEELNA